MIRLSVLRSLSLHACLCYAILSIGVQLNRIFIHRDICSDAAKTQIRTASAAKRADVLDRFMYICSHTRQMPQANLMLQVARQLERARAEVSNAEAASSGHASALCDKERQKKWMKF